jgi:hypothetical protein
MRPIGEYESLTECEYRTPRRCGHKQSSHVKWRGHIDTVCEICYLAQGDDSDPWHDFTPANGKESKSLAEKLGRNESE